MMQDSPSWWWNAVQESAPSAINPRKKPPSPPQQVGPLRGNQDEGAGDLSLVLEEKCGGGSPKGLLPGPHAVQQVALWLSVSALVLPSAETEASLNIHIPAGLRDLPHRSGFLPPSLPRRMFCTPWPVHLRCPLMWLAHSLDTMETVLARGFCVSRLK